MTNTQKKANWKFILLIILGCAALIAMGFTIPRFCMPFFEDVVYRNKNFQMTQPLNDEGEYEYELTLELKYDRDIRKLMLSFEFDNGSKTVTKQVTLVNFKKSGKEIMLKFTLKGDNYDISQMKYKIDEQAEFGILYSGEILVPALINAGLFITVLCFFVGAYKMKKRPDAEDEEENKEACDDNVKQDDKESVSLDGGLESKQIETVSQCKDKDLENNIEKSEINEELNQIDKEPVSAVIDTIEAETLQASDGKLQSIGSDNIDPQAINAQAKDVETDKKDNL